MHSFSFTSAGALGAILLALSSATVRAHHSWAGIYNIDESITIRGVVTEFLFRSPHLALMLDVANDGGEIERWTVEWGSPQRARDTGYDAGLFQPGDEITVIGQPAWTPSRKSVRMRTLTRSSDGLTLSGGRDRRRDRSSSRDPP